MRVLLLLLLRVLLLLRLLLRGLKSHLELIYAVQPFSITMFLYLLTFVEPDFGATHCRPSLDAGLPWTTMILCRALIWSHSLQTLSGCWDTMKYNGFV
jgi:hypothetical protein